MDSVELLYIDLFCGAGGTSTGVELARIDGLKCAEVIACVNHDPHAISSHQANHPRTMHFTEDIRTLDLTPLMAHLEKKRAEHPDALVVLWASLECTNFSKAKGGQPRDADSRTLAEHLFRYIEALKPDYIQIENVVEFMAWGDLDENGRPVSMDKGRLYQKWVHSVRKYGYDFKHRILNSADFGAYTSRKRFFGIFAKEGLPIVFPEPTHSRNPENTIFNHAEKWRPVREVLDLNDEGESIFVRKKPLSEATLRRIYAGLVKFVAGGREAFMIKYNSMSRKGVYHAPSMEEPCPTVSTQGRLAVAKVMFLSKYFSGSPDSKNISVDEPAGTITCRDHHSFITAYYGNGFNTSIECPFPTITTVGKFSIVTYKPFLMNPQFSSCGGDVDNPCFTLIARMDKMPPYLVTAKTGNIAIAVYDTDSPTMVRIKEFMALYGIIDIKMRMLKIQELKRIMGFPDNYILIGTQAEQKKYIGNAVEVNMARCLCEALCRKLRTRETKIRIA